MKINNLKHLSTFVVAIFIFACSGENQNEETVQNQIYPIEDSEKEIVLTYDSTVFLKKMEYSYFEKYELYFSDDKKNIWKFYAFNEEDLHGYMFHDANKNKVYKNCRFRINWKLSEHKTKDEQIINLAYLKNITLSNPVKDLKRNLIKLKQDDDIVNVINNAEAGDSIILESGNYYIKENRLVLSADYVSIIGSPGCFIYADIDFTVLTIEANYVKLSNIYLSHLNSENAECSGNVIDIFSEECRNLIIENCDINGCGVIGIDIWSNDEIKNVNYLFLNNHIHNNSEAPITINNENFINNTPNINGLVFENNKIWNNGPNKINEPLQFKNVFTFGLVDSVQNYITSSCPEINVYHFDKIEDKEIPFHGNDSNLIIGYINPFDFANGKVTGVLVYERFKPVKFYNEIPELCDSTKSNIQAEKMVIVYSDSKVADEYFEGGGEDWTWFVDDIWNYYKAAGIIVKSSDDVNKDKLDKLIKKHNALESGMGYFFLYDNESKYIAHDMPDEIKKTGDAFFKEMSLKELN